MPKLAVIVGRFQVPSLHAGHQNLILMALQSYDKVLVCLGSTDKPDHKNIIPYEVRKDMIQSQEHFDEYKEKFLFAEIFDIAGDDGAWSKNLDSIVDSLKTDCKEIAMLGSRDSFLQYYNGKYPKMLLSEFPSKSGTDVRQDKNRVSHPYSEDWVNGAIWAAENLSLAYDQVDRFSSNLILRTDSYKFSHWKMYDDLKTVYSYFESRAGAKFPETVFCGLQPILMKMSGSVVTQMDIEEADAFCKGHFGMDGMFNRKMWQYIVDEHKGKLPLRIKAVPEGTPVNIGNVLLTVENTDPNCPSLTNHFETWLTHIWYTSTVATLSRSVKVMIKQFLDRTSDTDAGLGFMLHDFGYRGVSSVESAGYGTLGHLVNFLGTDTVEGILYARKYYSEPMAGFSVPASEHSVMTSKGREGEYDVIANLIKIYPTGILSLVLDSFNIYNACEHLGTVLKDAILARNGKVVVRPDSGHPPEVTMKIIVILEKHFGFTVNDKGYKVLPPKIGIIYGDGLDVDMIKTILETLEINKWSASNLVFGMGGGLLQKVNRDTQRNAFKCSANENINGEWHDIFKDPIDGSKKSKAGKLKLIKKDNQYFTVKQDEEPDYPDQLVTVFENGDIAKKYTFAEVRANAAI